MLDQSRAQPNWIASYNVGMTKKRVAPAKHVQPYRYASPNIPLSAIRRFVRRIAEQFRPERIILFGSYAYGTPHVASDVDLLVIMPARNEIDQAIRIKQSLPRPFALDLIVLTPNKVARRLKDNDCFICDIIGKGRVLYEASNVAVGSQGRRRLRGSANVGRLRSTVA